MSQPQKPTIKKPFKPSIDDISDIEARCKKYGAYVTNIQCNRFTTGFPIVDAEIRGIGAGEVMLVAAYSGTFKSAYLQNLMMGYAVRSKLHSLFFSLEMPDEKIFEREMQIANDLSGPEIESMVIAREAKFLRHYDAAKFSGSSRVLTIERPKLSLGHIGDYIELAKSKYDLGMVGIDYLGLMKGDTGRSSSDLTEDMSNGAKELAKEYKLPVVMLTQINRAAAKAQSEDGAEIELHHLKYGGEAGADIVLGLYRDADDAVILKILKNRGGSINKRFKAQISPHSLKFDGFENYNPPKKKKGGDYEMPNF